MQVPKAQPDETLFSRIVRYISLSGLQKERCLNTLVGNRRAVIHPYLTADLDLISRFTNESANYLCREQTLRPLFSHFLPKYREIINDCSIGTNELVRACQLSTFREHEPLTLKYCPVCAEEDIYNVGVAYWHCSHQIPGVDACSEHGVWLIHQELHEREHFRSYLFPPTCDVKVQCSDLAWSFAQYAERKFRSIQDNAYLQFKPSGYKNHLSDKGFTTFTGRIKRIELMAALYSISEKILLPDNPLRITSAQDLKYMSSLIDGTYQVHPFKHLLLEFLLTQTQLSENPDEHVSTSRSKDDDVKELETRCCDLLLNGYSMAQVGRDIGKSRCYVKAVALRHHIPVNLKPYKITDSLKDKVSRLAYKGVHRSTIALQLGISSGSVEAIISSIEGLVEWRKKCKADSKRRRYQCQILRYFESHPKGIRKNAKEECEAAFFWLYLHNPEWLEQHLPVPQKTQHVDRVDWEKRDNELSKKVCSIIESCDPPICRTKLDKILGAHGWLTSKLFNLPKTKEALQQYKLFPSDKNSPN
ncbi:TnsD family Tn7-like transposition protein [Vibrio diazotrophicus]|uniref:TniQ protein n=2 Tax=Vibrio diazotrophicus TaxID=685 RepID=A0A329E4X1_VIBDI|nr:TnsD family Tn7-like transposition protein [Vibrio diazotrophicus]PNH97508.1 transposase [Vibrio diazotrophicus]RAS59605.1 TniQ protein [Vibrio diazotrophicus]